MPFMMCIEEYACLHLFNYSCWFYLFILVYIGTCKVHAPQSHHLTHVIVHMSTHLENARRTENLSEL